MGDTRATDSLLRGIETAKSGNKLLARLHLLQAVELAPRDPNCWLWLAWVAESPASAMHSLQRVLDEHPDHELAQLGMKWAAAMAEYEYQEIDSTDASTSAAMDTEPLDEAPPTEEEVAEQSATLEEEVSETETWEAETAESDNSLETPSFGEAHEELNGDGASVDDHADEPAEQFEVVEESTEQERDLVAEETASETTNSFDDSESQQVVLEEAGEHESSEEWEANSSTDWFTQDESVQIDALHDEPSFPIEDKTLNETSEVAETDEDEFEPEAYWEEKTESAVASETQQSDESPWDEQADDETLVAESFTEESTTEESASPVDAGSEDAEFANDEDQPSREQEAPAEQFQVTGGNLGNETEILEAQSQEPAIATAAVEDQTTDEALATAALVEAEMSAPEPSTEEAAVSHVEAILEENLPATSSKDTKYGVSVLVVDDSPTVRKLVTMTLEKNGFTVGAAADGVVALKSIAELKPRLILLDITMPRLGGYQLCKLIKKHESTKHIPVIMLSGKDGMFDKVRGKFVGCDDYITKPFDPEVLVEKVSTQLTEHYGVAGTKS